MTAAVYASASDLAQVVAGGTAIPDGIGDRLVTALIVGSRYVDGRLGNPVGDEPLTGPLDTDDLDVVTCDARWRMATINAAAYFYKLADTPFGIVGGWEYAVRVGKDVPNVDQVLGTMSWNIG